jgi:hypothetical protein
MGDGCSKANTVQGAFGIILPNDPSGTNFGLSTMAIGVVFFFFFS